MKWIGITLLFLLCLLIGLVRAARSEERCRILHSIRRDTEATLLSIRTRRLPLSACAAELPKGTVQTLLCSLRDGTPLMQSVPAVLPLEERELICRFFERLEGATAERIEAEGAAFLQALGRAYEAAQKQRERDRMMRSIGALCGAALAVLLW